MVAISVVSVAGVDVGGVEEDGHVSVAILVVVFLNVGEFVFLKEAGADYEDGHVGQAIDYFGVGDDFDRRAVENDEVVFTAQIFDESVELVAGKKLGGIGRHGAYAHGVEGVGVVNLCYKDIFFIGFADEQVGDALRGFADKLRQGAFAHVEVDYEHSLAFDSEDFGEVDGHECLAAAGVGGGDGYYLAFLVGYAVFDAHVFEIGAEHAEGFVDGIATLWLYNNAPFLLLMFLEACESAGLLVGGGYLSEIWHLKRRKVFLAAYLGVERLTHHKYAYRDSETEQESNHQYVAFLRECRCVASMRLLDHTGVVGGECLCQLVLLTFL